MVNDLGKSSLKFTKEELNVLKTSFVINDGTINNNSIVSLPPSDNDIPIPYLNIGVHIKIPIASRKKDCVKGIGFRCGPIEIYLGGESSIPEQNNPSSDGINLDRKYEAVVTNVNPDGSIQFEFVENVNWDWLDS